MAGTTQDIFAALQADGINNGMESHVNNLLNWLTPFRDSIKGWLASATPPAGAGYAQADLVAALDANGFTQVQLANMITKVEALLPLLPKINDAAEQVKKEFSMRLSLGSAYRSATKEITGNDIGVAAYNPLFASVMRPARQTLLDLESYITAHPGKTHPALVSAIRTHPPLPAPAVPDPALVTAIKALDADWGTFANNIDKLKGQIDGYLADLPDKTNEWLEYISLAHLAKVLPALYKTGQPTRPVIDDLLLPSVKNLL